MEYYKLIDACNNAQTERLYESNKYRLDGFRMCLQAIGVGWSGIEDDLRSIRIHGNVPMTCGVLHTSYSHKGLTDNDRGCANVETDKYRT